MKWRETAAHVGGGNDRGQVWRFGWWLRLIVAGGALGFATTVVGRWFLEHVFQIRNSPAALVLLVLLIQLVWSISHAPAGGVVALLKIVLGGCALVGASLGPASQVEDWSGTAWAWDFQRIGAALFAAWVVVDGLMDRRSNLRRIGNRMARNSSEKPAVGTIATDPSSDHD
jgi:hypothetical protein